MNRLPVTIVSGYLGAGKTTLINSLLAEEHGLKLAVIVNDFGAVNIDDALIRDTDGGKIALTNGCVCCTMGDDLSLALREILDRANRPDHLLIEASGISDPVAIANSVLNEPGLSYGGIVSLVDAENAETLLNDPLVAPQAEQQIRAADLVIATKCNAISEPFAALLNKADARTPTVLNGTPVAELLFDVVPLPKGRAVAVHPAYTTWQHRSSAVLDRRALGDKLAERPAGLYRMKGFVLTSGGAYELHVVGRHVEAKRCEAEETVLVGLGPADRISREEIEAWWTA
ncbi:CobW family GTP-binding protein [Leisingera daeponensis]|uniref:CobW family GTP-binding protein n=1 Tax=Leisingera daeponensis TaxID=405746 RepID=UPI001C975C77|nr:CobW family GTP-binding protein [Leisingera daeponensis]MBY6057066.1 GTP-binding protein [Leisingera daeponensis]